MPIYEYECGECSEVFEELRLGSDESLVCCPKCGSNNTRKLMSASCSLDTGKGLSIGGQGSSSCGSGGFT